MIVRKVWKEQFVYIGNRSFSTPDKYNRNKPFTGCGDSDKSKVCRLVHHDFYESDICYSLSDVLTKN